MERLAALRNILAPSTSIMLPKKHPSTLFHDHARTDSIPIRLHARELHFDKMVVIPVVLEKPVEAQCSSAAVVFATNPVFHQKVEKSIIVIIRPCREFVRGGRQVILELHPFLSCYVGKSSIAIVVIKKIGVSDALFVSRICDKKVKKSVVVIIAPDSGVCNRSAGETSLLRYIGESAVAIVSIEPRGRRSIPVERSGYI